MRLFLKLSPVFVILVVGVLAARPLMDWWVITYAKKYRTKPVEQGEIISVVNATGTVTPVLSVRVGSFASGPVTKLYVDYRTEVKKDEVLAEIDPTLYEATRDRDKATVEFAKSDVARVAVLYEQASSDEARARLLFSKRTIGKEEYDKFKANRDSLEAQVRVAAAKVKEAEANLRNSEKNLTFTKIRSPVDGMVLDRKIEEGQTLVAQFMVPDLFVVAKDLRTEIHVYASVDESDVALITSAQKNNKKVKLSVDAHPEELFEGEIHQVRLNSMMRENVVTYTVVVKTPNPDLKLLPGMTAKLSFEIEKRDNAVKVPNAALRFYPKKEDVHPDSQHVLNLSEDTTTSDSGDKSLDTRSATERVSDRQQTHKRHVWYLEEGRLRAIAVVTGISDSKYTELVVEKDAKLPVALGQQLVIGSTK